MASLRLALAIAAIAAIAAGHAQGPAAAPAGGRPTLEEWKEAQAAKKAGKEAAAKKQSKMAAVDKVITMLEDLQTQVAHEGEAEARTYDKFACFCKDATKDKNEAITDGQDAKAELEAEIESLTAQREKLDSAIESLVEEIKAAETELEAAAKERKVTLGIYEKNAADLSGALEALEAAIAALKASKPSLMQMRKVAKTVRRATMMADALGLAGAARASLAVATLLQQAPDVPMQDYTFHSDSIIETLEKLLKDFMAEKGAVDAAEVKSKAQHDAFVQEKTDYLKRKNAELEDAKKQKEEAQEEIAAASQRLSTVSADLLLDIAYLTELGKMCHERAITWDQRSQCRADELNALTQAISIIKGTVTEKTTAKTARLLQKKIDIRLATVVAGDAASMEAIEAEAEAADDGAAVHFLQLSSKPRKLLSALAVRHKAPTTSTAQQAVAQLLRAQGDKLKSPLLLRLASQVQDDPFAKVKKLIQELIERLLAEAANEANQKGWCDKAIGDAEQKRDYAAKEIRELNAEMAKLEAIRDELIGELEILGKEIAELEASRDKATKLREAEKAENAVTVEEAKSGVEAVSMAIDILTKFYKTAAKNKVTAELQQGPADDAPDAGFEAFEAYKGAQGSATGVIGMLEVIKGDFERTISETEKAEAQAQADYMDFMTETGKSLAEKQVAHDEKTKQKDDAEAKLATAEEKLETQTTLLEKSIEELIELKPACVETGMSYAERVALREEEMEALKKALCILENYEAYGPDGAADAC